MKTNCLIESITATLVDYNIYWSYVKWTFTKFTLWMLSICEVIQRLRTCFSFLVAQPLARAVYRRPLSNIMWTIWPTASANECTLDWGIVSRYSRAVRKWFEKTSSVLPGIIIPLQTFIILPSIYTSWTCFKCFTFPDGLQTLSVLTCERKVRRLKRFRTKPLKNNSRKFRNHNTKSKQRRTDLASFFPLAFYYYEEGHLTNNQ